MRLVVRVDRPHVAPVPAVAVGGPGDDVVLEVVRPRVAGRDEGDVDAGIGDQRITIGNLIQDALGQLQQLRLHAAEQGDARIDEAGLVALLHKIDHAAQLLLLFHQQGAQGRHVDLVHGQGGQLAADRVEIVVEIELDGVQRSSRYPGGVALRFARVMRYRPDKTPEQADTLGSQAQERAEVLRAAIRQFCGR